MYSYSQMYTRDRLSWHSHAEEAMNKRLFLNWKNLGNTRGLKELVLVESENDVRLMQSFGIRDVLGVGTGANITRGHMRTIKDLTYPQADISLVFAASRRGRQFAMKVIETIGTVRSFNFVPLPPRQTITKKFLEGRVSHHLFVN